jgi:REP element-mobilizing transposase RayT
METYRHGTYCILIHLHLVWITKYRKKLLTDRVFFRVLDMIGESYQQEDVENNQGGCVSIPP